MKPLLLVVAVLCSGVLTSSALPAAPDLVPGRLWNGAFELSFASPIPTKYTLYGSVDLQNWLALTTVTSSRTQVKLSDPDAGSFKRRFYRVSAEPIQIAAPAITETGQPKSQTVTEGASVTFSVIATGSGTLTYQWMFNGGSLAGATGQQLYLEDVHASDAGNYSVTVSNNGGITLSQVAVLTVNRRSLAPDSLAGKTMLCTITDGDWPPFAEEGSYKFLAATTGNTYIIVPQSGDVIPSSGTYTYTKTSDTTARIVIQDAEVGRVITEVIFLNADGGTFRNSAGDDEQTGNFSIQ